MRTFTMLGAAVLVTTLLALGGWAWSNRAAQQSDAAKVTQSDAVKVTLKVEGMTCSGCEAAVKMAAKMVDGVKDVSASAPKGIAEVSYESSKTNPDAIAKAITENSGFKASVPKDEPSNKSESK